MASSACAIPSIPKLNPEYGGRRDVCVDVSARVCVAPFGHGEESHEPYLWTIPSTHTLLPVRYFVASLWST